MRRTAGVAVVKNEADIVEAFVRHNLAYLGELYVVDNASCDGTSGILRRLAEELPALRLGCDSSTDHPQERVMSHALATWPEPLPDWVFCLDADEFIDADSPAAFNAVLASLPMVDCRTLRWEFFVPTPTDDPKQANPIRRITHRRCDGAVDGMLAKVVVPTRFLRQPDLRVRAGNHFLAQANGVVLPHAPIDGVGLGHFPVRSADQLAGKAVIGAWAVNARATRDPHEASHWAELKDRVLAGYPVGGPDLTDAAYNYAVTEAMPRVSPAQFQLQRRPLVTTVEALPLTDTSRSGTYRDKALSFADAHFATLRSVALATGKVEVVKTRRGLLVLTPATPSAQHNALRGTGDWAGAEVDFVVDAVAAGDEIWDFAPGCGYRALALAARVGPAGRVVSAQPDVALRADISASATLNGLRNVTVVAAAAEVLADAGPAAGRRRWPWRTSGRRAGSLLRPPSLVVFDGGRIEQLQALTAIITIAEPMLFVTGAHRVDVPGALAWAAKVGYGWNWFISASDDARVPRVAMVGTALSAQPAAALPEVTGPHDTWAAAWRRQHTGFNAAPARWAMARHGLDPRWR